MSFPRMRESPSMAQLGIPAFAGMTRKGSFHTSSFAGMTRKGSFHTSSFAGMTEMRLLSLYV
ncbi:MAG: hypothetical protein NT007_15575 [Candidatus Kapabacteria bacterium]|nr:hypothetical protein [Candidatus Kapabacteria bacterium]